MKEVVKYFLDRVLKSLLGVRFCFGKVDRFACSVTLDMHAFKAKLSSNSCGTWCIVLFSSTGTLIT